jgi:hypothetical protein
MSMYIRERPCCRKTIIERGLRPHLDENGKWDGRMCDHLDGRVRFLSDGMRAQMRLMLSEGY